MINKNSAGALGILEFFNMYDLVLPSRLLRVGTEAWVTQKMNWLLYGCMLYKKEMLPYEGEGRRGFYIGQNW